MIPIEKGRFPGIDPRSRRWVVLGNGGHARVAASALIEAGVGITGSIGPAEGGGGWPLLGNDDWMLRQTPNDYFLINGVGANPNVALRRDLFERFRDAGFYFPPVVHVKALLADDVSIGDGVQVMMGAILQASVVISDNAVINTGAIVEHDVNVGSDAFIGPGTTICGGVRIGSSAFVGAGAVVLPGIEIGGGAIVAAGATVTRPVLAGETVAGCPARVMER